MSLYANSAPKNGLQEALNNVSSRVGQPSDDQERITYGVISEVDHATSQVKVKLLTDDGIIGEEISPGFLPLVTPLSEIHLLWGMLRDGLVVRIYWRGKADLQRAIIEVIGDEDHRMLSKEPVMNELKLGAFKIFGGGIM